MKKLDSVLLKSFLNAAGDRLKGRWLLIGGTLLPAVGLDIRSTTDIDLIGLTEVEQAQALEVMELSESLGLPVETVNQAASFFLKKVGYKPNDLLPLVKGKRATVFRPSVLLYWKLKLARLTETDLVDCQHYFHYCIGQNDKVELKTLKSTIQLALESEASIPRRERLLKLKSLL